MTKIVVTCYECSQDIHLSSKRINLILPVEGGDEEVLYHFTCPMCDTICLRPLPDDPKIFKVLQEAGVKVISAPLEVSERISDSPRVNSDDLLDFCISMQKAGDCLAQEFFD